MKSSDQRSVNVGDGSPCQFRMREKKLNVGVLLRQKKKKITVLKSMFIRCWVPEGQADLCRGLSQGKSLSETDTLRVEASFLLTANFQH